MSSKDFLSRYLSDRTSAGLQLRRLGDDESGGLVLVSVPLCRNASAELNIAKKPTFVKPLGKWYDAESPRRLLMVADSGGRSPQTLNVARGLTAGDGTPPEVAMEVFASAPAEDLPFYYWERSALTIAWGGKKLSIAMGLRVGTETHWWEACNIVVNKFPSCVEVEMGGAIPYEVTTAKEMKVFEDKDNPYVHKHNWVNGHIYARIHSNGVVEIYAHHVNSMFFDDGADFKNAVPVIGFRNEDGERAVEILNGVWDGSCRELKLGDVVLDMTDVVHLATKGKPGRLYAENGFVVLQPYRGAELYGGYLTEMRIGDECWWRAEQEIFPRGMARTLRFSLSLNPERSPRVVRYLAPAWWYGLCEEFQPKAVLPAKNEYDESVRTAREWFHKYMIKEGFEDGMTPQGTPESPDDRTTPSGEGDIPGGLFLAAYRTGDAVDYDCALRATYAIVDVFVDHAVNRTRFPGHQAGAVALPLQRMHGPILGWLETGDEYLLRTAVAVIDNAYSWHKNSWPRRAVGRDARFLHSQMVLYRYLGYTNYLDRTRDVIKDLSIAQWQDGTFGDQGGGTGIHSFAAYIIKPWMGCMATLGVLDYLEQFPDDELALSVVKKFVDFLMKDRALRLKDYKCPEKGQAMGWTYQHPFRGKNIPGVCVPDGPFCGGHLFHLDYMARLLTWYSYKKGNPEYFNAYAESCEGKGCEREGAYFWGTQVFLFITWLEDRLWNATVTENGLEVEAMYLGEHTPKKGVVMTPDGDKEFVWTAPGKLDCPKDVRCKVVDLTKK